MLVHDVVMVVVVVLLLGRLSVCGGGGGLRLEIQVPDTAGMPMMLGGCSGRMKLARVDGLQRTSLRRLLLWLMLGRDKS